MNTFQFAFGAIITFALNFILYITGEGTLEDIQSIGLVLALLIIFAFVSIVKIMIANSVKDNQATNWIGVGYFVGGSAIITAATIISYFIAIR